MDDQLPREVVQERFDRLVALVQESAFAQNQLQLGETLPVLVEGCSKRDETMLTGRSPRNQTVHAKIPEGHDIERLRGTVVDVHVEDALTWYLRGSLVGFEEQKSMCGASSPAIPNGRRL